MTKNNDILWYWFCNISGIGVAKQRYLLEYFEKPENIFTASEKEFDNVSHISKNDVDNIISGRDIKKIEKSYEKMKSLGIDFYNIEESGFPKMLKQVYDHPYGIYCKGKMPDNDKRTVAIVGARNCSDYGRYMAKEIGKALSLAGVQVISGFARGIDTYSHIGALKGTTPTYAVFGCGCDICYPIENIELYEEVVKNGGIISEYPPKTSPLKGYFPMRNRIISGMAEAIIVIEARKKSGSLITADQGLEQGKEIFAVPGRCTDPLSQGCLNLIKSGAGMILSVEDLLFELNLKQSETDTLAKKSNISLESHKKMVYSDLDCSVSKNTETIIGECGLEPGEVSAILLELEVMGLIRKVSNNYYIRI